MAKVILLKNGNGAEITDVNIQTDLNTVVTDIHGLFNYPHFKYNGHDIFFVCGDSSRSVPTNNLTITLRGQPYIFGNALITGMERDEYGSPDLGSLSDKLAEELLSKVKDGVFNLD